MVEIDERNNLTFFTIYFFIFSEVNDGRLQHNRSSVYLQTQIKMKEPGPITKRNIHDINRILGLIDNLKVYRERFYRSPHKRQCNCLLVIPSSNTINDKVIQVRALKDLAILTIKLQNHAPMPTMAVLIRDKIEEQITTVNFLIDNLVDQAELHGFKKIDRYQRTTKL